MITAAYWRDEHWQHDAVARLRSSLDDLHIRLLPLGWKDSEWTAEVMRAVSRLTPQHCSCAHKRSERTEHYSGGEWMFDLCWIAQQPNPRLGEAAFTIGIPLVLECEWLDWQHIWDDFDKLLLANAGLKVMIFQRHKDTPPDWDAVLFERVAAFAEDDVKDAWLIACWSKPGFTFRQRIGGVID